MPAPLKVLSECKSCSVQCRCHTHRALSVDIAGHFAVAALIAQWSVVMTIR